MIEAAVRFVAAQAGGPDRILATHYRLHDGSCAGCITTMASADAVGSANDPEDGE